MYTCKVVVRIDGRLLLAEVFTVRISPSHLPLPCFPVCYLLTIQNPGHILMAQMPYASRAGTP